PDAFSYREDGNLRWGIPSLESVAVLVQPSNAELILDCGIEARSRIWRAGLTQCTQTAPVMLDPDDVNGEWVPYIRSGGVWSPSSIDELSPAVETLWVFHHDWSFWQASSGNERIQSLDFASCI